MSGRTEKLVVKLSGPEEQRAQELHRKAIIIDAASVPNMGNDSYDTYLHLTNRGGITAVCASIVHVHGLGMTLKNISDFYRRIARNSDVAVGPVTSAEEIEKAKRNGKTALMIHFHNTLNLEPNLYFEHGEFPNFPIEPEFPDWLLETYYKLGVRVIQPVRNYANLMGSGYLERGDAGLTTFGVEGIEAMNKIGILIDASHANDKTTMDIIEISKDPVALTHANARGLFVPMPPHERRNKTDEAIKALAEKGGVIGITTWKTIVGKPPKDGLEEYLDHIDYAVKLIGVDHVGISNDFGILWPSRPAMSLPWKPHPGKAYGWPEGHTPLHITTFDDQIAVTKGLVKRGYSDQEILKMLGSNFLGLFKRVFGR